MKFCAHCGNQLLDEAILCPKCGCATIHQKNTSVISEKSTLSLFALIFSMLVPIIGFVLGIVGLFYHKIETCRKRSVFAIFISLAQMLLISVMIFDVLG